VLRVEQYGGFTLVSHGPEKDTIDKALKRLDPELFLDPEFSPTSGVFWTVKYSRGDQYPLLVTDWREADGSPRELGWAIVDDLKRKEGLGWTVAAEVVRANKLLEERHTRDAEAGYFEVAGDMLPRVLRPRKTLPPRGVALRMSRDKQRNRGENV